MSGVFPAAACCGGLRNESIRDLIHVGVELLEVYALRSRVGHVSEETARQLSLDAEIPLLNVSVLLQGICRGGEVAAD